MTKKSEIIKALNLCIKALNEKGNEEYSQQVATVIRQLYAQPYQGRGLGIGDLGEFDYRANWEAYRLRWQDKKAINTGLDWKTAFTVLTDAINTTDVEIFAIAQKITNENIIFNHILKHIITNCVVQDDVEQALSYIPYFRDSKYKPFDSQDNGYLILLQYFANKGDNKNFFKYFKLAKPAINRNEVAYCKHCLVKSFSENNSLDEVIKLCKHRNLGEKFYHSALEPFAEKGMYQKLKTIFIKQPELKQPKFNTEIKILVEAYLKASGNDIKVDDDFEWLFTQCTKIDRKIRFGDVKLQDAMLLDLGIASQRQNDNERALKCRKAIKDNRMKRELVLK